MPRSSRLSIVSEVMIGVKETTSNEQILAVKEGLAALKDTCGILEFEFLALESP